MTDAPSAGPSARRCDGRDWAPRLPAYRRCRSRGVHRRMTTAAAPAGTIMGDMQTVFGAPVGVGPPEARPKPNGVDVAIAIAVGVVQIGGTALAAHHQPARRPLDVLG